MALIKCPECGREVSDKAKNCPECAYPIADLCPTGPVRIRMSPVKAPTGLDGKQRVTITTGLTILWEGQAGQIAELFFDEPTNVTINYHLSFMHYGGKCKGLIDPAQGKKYNVHARQGIMKTIIELQRVDVIDSD